MEVKVSDIIIPPYYIRGKNVQIKGLADSIKHIGLGHKIQVDKNLVLVDGLRRLEALKKNRTRRTEVEVVDIPKTKIVEYQLMIDFHKKHLNPIERARALKSYIKQHGYSHREAEKKLGFSKSTIGFHLKLLELPKEIQEDILSGKMKPYAVEKLIYKKKIKNIDEFKKKSRQKQLISVINRISAIKTFVRKGDWDYVALEKIRKHIGDILFLIEKKSYRGGKK